MRTDVGHELLTDHLDAMSEFWDNVSRLSDIARQRGYMEPRRTLMSIGHANVRMKGRKSEYEEDLEALDDPENANPDVLNRARLKQLYHISRRIESLQQWANNLRTLTGQEPLKPPPMDISDRELDAAEKRFSLLELDDD